MAEAGQRQERRAHTRIVWIVFDEWDQRLSFDERPEWLDLPELDRFRQEALFAEHAVAPSEQTAVSMTSFLLGRIPSAVEPSGLSDLSLTFRDEEAPVLWSESPNLITKARAAGLHTGVVGWFMPYCPMLGGSVDTCWWHDWKDRARLGRRDVGWLMSSQWQALARNVRLSTTGGNVPAAGHSQLFRQILPPALEAAADAALGFVLLHLPIPHGPHFFDSSTGAHSWSVSQTAGYLDSLALVDLTFGQVRRAMAEASIWDSTTVLLSSDHSLRASEQVDGKRDHRVPFLLKLPGQREALRYEQPFNTVLTHDLMLALMSGEIRRPAQAAAWLDRHRDTAPATPVF